MYEFHQPQNNIQMAKVHSNAPPLNNIHTDENLYT